MFYSYSLQNNKNIRVQHKLTVPSYIAYPCWLSIVIGSSISNHVNIDKYLLRFDEMNKIK